MSDIRFNRWLHQSGTGGVSQDSSGNIGIGTTVPTKALDVRGDVNIGNTININNASGIISATTFTGTTGTFSGNVSAVDATFTGNVTIGGTLTYEDVANIDAVGIITAQSDIIVGGGLTVTGISTFNNDVKLLDSDILKFGIGEDLQIYHDSTSGKSHIKESGPGLLQVDTNNFSIRNSQDTEQLAYFTENAGVGLYYNNSKKFETTNTGAVITGILTATTFSGNLTGNVTGDLTGNLAGISSIAAISSSISDTAVDVFVYDTSKDSDGGAWRKRTQHTSWYNETLGTATRGTRKEFPAVAVIVATADDLIIYDGDDPDLPMWMVFESDEGATAYNTHFLGRSSSASFSAPITSISMLNGLLSVGKTGSSNFIESFNTIDFIKEDVLHRAVSSFVRHSPSSISKRNNTIGYTSLSATGGIVNYAINDVAMTVLPNAPIDDATGLPVPTIAVATNGGVSIINNDIINNDGTVADIVHTTTLYNNYVHFIRPDLLTFSQDNAALYKWTSFVSIPTSDQSNTYAYNSTTYTWYANFNATGSPANILVSTPTVDPENLGYTAITPMGSDMISFGSSKGLGMGTLDDSPPRMVSYATTSYNSGYMVGDIKGAFLSDTDTTNVTGTELWPEGDFADANEWSSAGAEWTISGGTATVSDGNGGYSFLGSSSGTLTNGKKYVLSFTVSNYSGGRLEASQANSSNIQIPFSANGSYSQLINYTGTSGSGLGMYGYGGGAVGFTLDNLYLRELEEEDRSVNNTGLAVYGTITKSAVATGAELVKYGGFSSSNALVQPYNSDMDWGTGDFYYMIWVYHRDHTGLHGIISRQTDGQSSGNRFQFQSDNDGKYDLYSASNQLNLGSAKLNVWSQLAFVRSGSTVTFYQDGYNIRSWTDSTNYTNSGANLRVGGLSLGSSIADNSYPADGVDFALFRTGGSAPSPEQIKKIYEDEKVLFQENAKATLYGSSDAVTALGYDEDTELLHVGTSAGRSDFQGLRRINNTTTAVTTAISASDDLIAEQ